MKRMLTSLARLTKTVLAYRTHALRGDLGYEVLELPPGERVLVCAPHPDDDVIGCGGAIARLRAAGKQVDILYQFDVTSERWEEGKRGAELLGIPAEHVHRVDQAQPLSTFFEQLAPDTVYLPSSIDNHPDHIAMHRAVLDCVRDDVTLVNYEVWTPVFFNKILPIDDVIKAKQAAIRAHRSQLKDRDYEAALLGLAQYRAASLGVGRYAEAYLVVSPAVARRLATAAVEA